MSVPMYFLVVVFAGWLNRQQQAVIEYLKAENEILKSQLRGRRPRLTDGERRRLAVKGKAIGRKLLTELACLVTPEMILAWHRAAGGVEVDLSAASGRSTAGGRRGSRLDTEAGRQRFELELYEYPRSAAQSRAPGQSRNGGKRVEGT